MKRIGAVIQFKPDVSEAEAAMGLNQIRHLLDLPKESVKPVPEVRDRLQDGETVRFVPSQWQTVPFRMTDAIQEYDDDWGDPVWYIP